MSALEKLLPLLDPESLVRVASPKALKAGQELFKNKSVSDIVVDEKTIRGRVKGTHAVPHSTSLKRGKGGKLTAHCGCPTFTDGWEKVCHHAIALALAFHRQYHEGGELTVTKNPWVNEDTSGRRLQIESRRGMWHVQAFSSGSAVEQSRRSKSGDSRPEKMLRTFLDMEVDEAESGAHILEDHALAGLLFFARHGAVSMKGVGKLKFVPEPLLLRVEAKTRGKDARVELRAFLEHASSERHFDVAEGRVISGSPTWFLWPETAEVFMCLETPPWVLEKVAEQGSIVMDSRVDADQMERIVEDLQNVGVPQSDIHSLAADKRYVDNFQVVIEGKGEMLAVRLFAVYGNVTIAITGENPETGRYSLKTADDQITFYRDLDKEASARKVLTDSKLRFRESETAFTATGDDAIEFMVAGISMLPEEWEKKVPKLPKIRRKSPSPKVSVKNAGGSVLDVEALVNVDGQDDLISFRDLLRWLHEGRRWITLADGSVAKLDPKILEPVAEAAGALQFDKVGHAEASTLDLGTLARLLQEVPSAEVAKDVKKMMANMVGEKKTRAPRKAKALTAKLREYQRSGFAWLWQLHENGMTGILADDMGLGKTVQALALLTKSKEAEGDGPSLIVGPTSVLGVWRDEVKKWAPSLSVLIWHGPDRNENARLLTRSDVVVTSYALLRRDVDDTLSKVHWRYVILDEAQFIKNWTTSTAKAAKRLKAEHRLALTGTPIENHLVDLWAIFDFLAPGFLGKIGQFQKNYVKPIEDGDGAQLEALRARIRPFIMRRRKEDVAQELPKKTEQTIYVHFSKSQLGLYNRILKAAKTEIQGKVDEVGLDRSQMTILAALTRLRQVCTDPRLLGLPEGSPVPPSAKLEAFTELIGEVVGSGRKALVFSQFVSMQQHLAQTLEEMEIEYVWIHGGTKNRDELVKRFQQKEGPPVFLISLKAGGTGLTLTEADTVIHYDPWWNPAVEDQATDRAHRIGQEKPVMVYRLVVEHTVEQKMVELGQEKRRVAETALGRDSKLGKKLTMDDVDRLLEVPMSSWDEV